jgi:hypothetical protein
MCGGMSGRKTRIKRLKYRLLILADSHNSKIDTDIPKKKAHTKKFHKIEKENEWEKWEARNWQLLAHRAP